MAVSSYVASFQLLPLLFLGLERRKSPTTCMLEDKRILFSVFCLPLAAWILILFFFSFQVQADDLPR